MKNLGQIMKQAQEMQDRMAELQQSLDGVEVEGAAGGGVVTVTLNGKGEMRRLKVDPSLANADAGERLVAAAAGDIAEAYTRFMKSG